jgi:hypothetical protein
MTKLEEFLDTEEKKIAAMKHWMSKNNQSYNWANGPYVRMLKMIGVINYLVDMHGLSDQDLKTIEGILDDN